MDKIKMICVMRTDLRNTDGMRLPKGKLIAQGGHAYMGAVLNLLKNNPDALSKNNELKQWLDSSFTKICLKVDSEEELLGLYKKLKESDINVVLITDNGDTQFGGIKTPTCIGIGPDYSSKLDAFTGHLKGM